MKKITLSVLFLFVGMALSAQTVEFVQNGNVLDTSKEIRIEKPYALTGEEELDGHIHVKNIGNASVEATLTISVLTAPEECGISICGFGTSLCQLVEFGNPVSRTMTIQPGEEIDPKVETVGAFGDVYAEVEFNLVSGATTKALKVIFASGTRSDISTTNASDKISVYQNGNIFNLSYNFESNANRQLNVYAITGELISSDLLSGNQGAASVSLNKGFYLYSIVENNKVVATDKFIVR